MLIVFFSNQLTSVMSTYMNKPITIEMNCFKIKKQVWFTIVLFFSLFISSITAQSGFYVTAKKGLIVRDQPDISGTRVGKFVYGTKVKVLEETDKILTITDDGKTIKGNWVRVSDLATPYGIDNKGLNCYVFNGFLSDKKISIPKFQPSTEYVLSKVDTTLIDKEDYSTHIYLENKQGKKIKKFKVWMDGYDENYSILEVIKNPALKNIKKIIKVGIEHCGCGCSDDMYYWLVTNENKWISLPMLSLDNIDEGNIYQEYLFNTTKNTIELIEFKFLVEENIETIKNIYVKHLKNLSWDGMKIKK